MTAIVVVQLVPFDPATRNLETVFSVPRTMSVLMSCSAKGFNISFLNRLSGMEEGVILSCYFWSR